MDENKQKIFTLIRIRIYLYIFISIIILNNKKISYFKEGADGEIVMLPLRGHNNINKPIG